MVKIFIGKSESVTSVVRKIITTEDSHVILVIPRNALLKEPANNFHLMKREADNAKKKIVIESVDEEVLAFAKASHLESFHPLFRVDLASRSLSDIVPAMPRMTPPEASEKHGEKGKKGERKAEFTKDEEIKVHVIKEKITPSFTYKEERKATREKRKVPQWVRRLTLALLGLVVLFGGILWVSTRFFGRLDITLNFQKIPWQHANDFLANKSVNRVAVDQKVLPAQLFTQSKNLIQLFPASGRRNVSDKATGRLAIYNAYSSEPQPLVATTRFATSDGKIFRLDKAIVVPGAEVRSGQIIPSSIEAAVTADKPGADYNLGPIERLTIPGFKGTAKYQGFYGTLREPTGGGFIGERAVPTDKDIAAAKEKVTDILKTALQSKILGKFPSDFKILDGASKITVTRLSVNRDTDQEGNFSVFGEAELIALGFKEGDLLSLFAAFRNQEYPSQSFREMKFAYSKISPDFDKGELRFSASAEGVLEPAFLPEDFKKEILGKKIRDAKTVASRLQGLNDAKISFWPWWMRKVPKNPSRVIVTVK